jgi:formimidoylglutamate deiminase
VTSSLFFNTALLPTGLAKNTRLTLSGGLITSVEPGATPSPTDEHHNLALPGMPNLHSHSFQRAIAGLTEHRANPADSFWSWRDLMYRFAHKMTPDDIESVATQAFVEMLETGFCAVAEFHYLHHDINGKPYANIAETASRIAAAAAATGISLLLLPVFYAHANFGGAPPTAAQSRFITSLDAYANLLNSCKNLPNTQTGIAPHSLRAVTPHQLQTLTSLAETSPFHIHIAEQQKEVQDCLAWSGARPIEWLLANAPVGPNWCLIHATHATAAERAAIAARRTITGLCPITEANLGDGIFNAHHLIQQSGSYGIGSDSNVLISATQELRQLEYSQRLLHQQRNVLATPNTPATATALYQQAIQGGAQALGRPIAGLQPGAPADIVTLTTATLDEAIFATRENPIDTVWAAGHKQITNGRHPLAETARIKFNATVARLT